MILRSLLPVLRDPNVQQCHALQSAINPGFGVDGQNRPQFLKRTRVLDRNITDLPEKRFAKKAVMGIQWAWACAAGATAACSAIMAKIASPLVCMRHTVHVFRRASIVMIVLKVC